MQNPVTEPDRRAGSELPMPEGGTAEAGLTADWNAERVERMRRYPRLRDRSIFVGNPADLVDVPLGPELPSSLAEPAILRFANYRASGGGASGSFQESWPDLRRWISPGGRSTP